MKCQERGAGGREEANDRTAKGTAAVAAWRNTEFGRAEITIGGGKDGNGEKNAKLTPAITSSVRVRGGKMKKGRGRDCATGKIE